MIRMELRSLLLDAGLQIAGEVGPEYAELANQEHECSGSEATPLPPFYVVDVRLRTDANYGASGGRWLGAERRFKQYKIEGAVAMHCNCLGFPNAANYRVATPCEFASALPQAPWLHSLRGKAFRSADLTLQVYYKPLDGLIWGTKDGSGPKHHLLMVPNDIQPRW